MITRFILWLPSGSVLGWLLFFLLIAPVSAADEDPELPVTLIISAFVLGRLQAWMRRAKNKIQKRQWDQAVGLRAFNPPKKPRAEMTPKKLQETAAAPAEDSPQQPPVEQPVPAPAPVRPAVDPDARHPKAPWSDNWLTDDAFKDWLFVQDSHVYCACCVQQSKGGLFVRGKPTSDRWVRGQLTQHASTENHKDAVNERQEDTTAATNLKKARSRALAALALPLGVIIRLVYWLCVENVAMMKLASLYSMVTVLPQMAGFFRLDASKNYVNAARCREFVFIWNILFIYLLIYNSWPGSRHSL
jgi:hypothetical protein